MAELDVAEVSRYLSSRIGSPVEIDKLKQTFPGASRETWLVFARVSGEEQGFTVRVDAPEGPSVPLSLEREYEVYRRLYGSDIPVAEPLWFDRDIDFVQGRPHMVRRLVEGSTSVAGLQDHGPEGDALRRRIAYETMEKLAAVHKVDWQALGLGEVLPVPPSADQALRAEFDQWRQFWNDKRETADPLMAEALHWLSENVPTDTPRIGLVKGNNGVGEEIFRDGRIVALSDWELATLGDGALDLSFSQGTMQLADFGDILRHYEACVGHSVSPERLAFSSFLIWLKQITCTRSNMLRLYTEGKSKRLLAVSLGLVHSEGARARIARCIGRNLVDVWHEVATEERNIYTSPGGGSRA